MPGRAILRVALKVDRNIDLEFVQEPGNLSVAFRPHIKKLIKRRDQPCSHLAAVVWTE